MLRRSLCLSVCSSISSPAGPQTLPSEMTQTVRLSSSALLCLVVWMKEANDRWHFDGNLVSPLLMKILNSQSPSQTSEKGRNKYLFCELLFCVESTEHPSARPEADDCSATILTVSRGLCMVLSCLQNH